jgi:O-antigen ligase
VALVSTRWAESSDQALTDANRYLLYAALFAILILLLRNDRLSRIVIGASGAAILTFGLYLATRMAIGEGSALFLGNRLNEPLGYINGEASYLLLGFWPCVALAERAERSWIAGVGACGATLLAGLAVLSQTRALVPAALLSTIILVGFVPGRGRRLWALTAIGLGVGAALGPLLEVYESGSGLVPASGLAASAARWLLVAAVGTGVIWGLASRAWLRLPGRFQIGHRTRTVIAAAPAVGVAAVLLVLLIGSQPWDRVGREYDNFVQLRRTDQADSRFTTGAGNRYDYWRIAVDQFADDPLRGVGAGNFDRTYFLERRTTEDITQAHSMELQILGELGLPGFVALLAFLLAIVAGFARRARAARASLDDRALAVGAGGAFFFWLLHTSVDWIHLIPGVTGLALAAAAVLVAPWATRPPDRGAGIRRIALFGSVAAIVLGAALVGRAAMAERYRSAAQDLAPSAPLKAIAKANDSLRLDDENLDTYYIKAAALARLDQYASARATLLEAARREPHEFVPWGLIGDLAVRRGNLTHARVAYHRASVLNPRDATLRRLAADPAAAQSN